MPRWPGAGDHIALWQSPAAQHHAELADSDLGEKRPVQFLTDEDAAQLMHQRGEVGTVDDLLPGAFG